MGGILQNGPKDGSGVAPGPESEPFDRKKVLENTKLNAQLGAQGDALRREIGAGHHGPDGEGQHTKYPKTKAPTNLHFDEDDILSYDEQRGQHQEILEPKTPYEGTAASTEYYDEDEDVPAPDPEEFALGEAVDDAPPKSENFRISRA